MSLEFGKQSIRNLSGITGLRWKKRQKKKKKIEIVVTSYDARISELKQQISILENKKREVEENPSSYMEGLIKNKEKVVK